MFADRLKSHCGGYFLCVNYFWPCSRFFSPVWCVCGKDQRWPTVKFVLGCDFSRCETHCVLHAFYGVYQLLAPFRVMLNLKPHALVSISGHRTSSDEYLDLFCPWNWPTNATELGRISSIFEQRWTQTEAKTRANVKNDAFRAGLLWSLGLVAHTAYLGLPPSVGHCGLSIQNPTHFVSRTGITTKKSSSKSTLLFTRKVALNQESFQSCPNPKLRLVCWTAASHLENWFFYPF